MVLYFVGAQLLISISYHAGFRQLIPSAHLCNKASKELKRVSLATFNERTNFIASSKLKSLDYKKMMAENLDEQCIKYLVLNPKKFDQKCEAAIVRYWLEN